MHPNFLFVIHIRVLRQLCLFVFCLLAFCADASAGSSDWREQNFATRANTGNAADLADPDTDGLPNLCEYGLSRVPGKPDPSWGKVAIEGSNITITYSRRKAALTEIAFEPVISATLAGPWSTAGFVQSVLSDDGTTQVVKASISSSAGRFIKLQLRRILNEPAVPASFSAVASSGRVNLSWVDVSNETSYKIERRISGGTFAPYQTLPANTVAFQDSSVMEGYTYIYRIYAINDAGDSSFSADARITVPVSIPTAPDNGSATATATQVTLSWRDNSSNESGFKIERRISGGSFSPLTTVAANVITLQDNNLTSGVTYIYRICATNNVGDSAWAADVRISTPQVPPSVPISFTATAPTATQVNLSWSDTSSNEGGFKIERRVSGGSFAPLLTVAANTSNYQDTSVTSGITYIYRICSTNSAGDSAWSADARITTPSIPPAMPLGLLMTISSGTEIRLNWNDNSDNESGFKIERRISGGSFAPLATTGQNSAGYLDSTVQPGITYIYRICATNSAGDSAWTAEVRGTTPVAPPSAPNNLSASAASATQVNLSWNDTSSNESSFKIERKVSGGDYAPLTSTGADIRNYQDNTAVGGMTYLYRVCATNSGGDSAWTSDAQVTTPGSTGTANVAVTTPVSRMVFQRNNSNQANIPVRGTYTGSPERIEARVIARASGQGTSTDWTTIANNPGGGNFSGKLLVNGGWYQLEVRAVMGGSAGSVATLDRVGVGEVFVVAGHSVAQGQDINIEGATDDRVSAVHFDGRSDAGRAYGGSGDMNFLPMAFSQFGNGIRPAPFGDGTYFWAKMGQHLVDRLNVPVLIFNAGFGGTSLEHWAKASQGQYFEHGFVRWDLRMPYINIYNVLKRYATVTGIRGVLADQGANDASRILEVGENQVYSDYQTWVNQARNDIGHGALAIIVNRNTPFLGTGAARPEVRNVQLRMISSHPNCFVGPDYDSFGTDTNMRYDGTHMAAGGEYVAAQWWADSITNTGFLNNSQPFLPNY